MITHEKCFQMVWSLSGADRLLNRSEKGEVVVVAARLVPANQR